MGRCAIVVLGPAGSGKSTFCATLQECFSKQLPSASYRARTVHIVNLDPASEDVPYEASLDIRSEYTSDDFQESHNLGPNGALVQCLEDFVLHDSSRWFAKNFGQYEDDFVIFDLPGQIEIIAQIPIVPELIRKLTSEASYKVVVCYLLDSQCVVADRNHYISSCLCALSAMTAIEAPFLSLLTKTDRLPPDVLYGKTSSMEALEGFYDDDHYARDNVDRYGRLFDNHLSCNFDDITSTETAPASTSVPRARRFAQYEFMTKRLSQMISEFSLVSFVPWSANSEESHLRVTQLLDFLLQFGDDEEVHEVEIPDERNEM